MERFRPRKPTTRETVLAAGLAGLVGVAGHIMNTESDNHDGGDVTLGHQPTDKLDSGVNTRRRQNENHEAPNQTVPDHETYRQRMGDEVLHRLADLDPNFSITSTNQDQFFGIDYHMPDGNYRALATVYPNEQTRELQLSPDDELSRWVEDRIGSALNGWTTTNPDEITDAAADLLELNDLMMQDKAGQSVSSSAVEEQLMKNKTVTTEEARQEQEEQAADTGD